MNSKRQTIWLVSMLSLMVVLSAYYLFTDDPNKKETAAGDLNTQDIIVGLNELTPEDAAKAADKTAPAAAGGTDAAKSAGTNGTKTNDSKASDSKSVDAKSESETKTGTKETTTAKTDEQVIQQIQSQGKSGQEYIITEQMKRNEEFKLSMENLISIMTDPKKSQEEAVKATNEYNAIEQRELKLTGIEETLGKNYDNVVVLQENEKWKVVVQAAKLEKSEGASIVTLVMNELNVGPEKVVVQSIAQ
ncbi:SpoIIIAH-like family protein [Paenibacillus contaminans]|uniref:SpoIIIAH-like family protein n=1 Tax=Paenibacillus contaminans TaxID=450362 RepID=A0A329MFE8_9BACL|nr:SpoIIIAH-like family protein [Paenibacillus contaminans]RAV18659.1 SpoIIIAH-like family protein [Paenibacillus contaminans]